MFSNLYKLFFGYLKSGKLHPNADSKAETDCVPEDRLITPGLQDRSIWNCALGKHFSGEFSFAVVQANTMIEDYSQVESGSFGTFVGIYDGHGGAQAAKFLCDKFFQNLQNSIQTAGMPSDMAFLQTFHETEQQFLQLVRDTWQTLPQFASVGSCVLTGYVHDNTLYVASLGDSRAVLGTVRGMSSSPSAVELSTEHNASDERIREEIRKEHPEEEDIVVEKGGTWRVKGIIQVTRTIGDFYLKHEEFQRTPLYTKFRLPSPLLRPALSCEPSLCTHKLNLAHDKFVVFASDGLWEHISSEEAVAMVHQHGRKNIARRLVKTAIVRAARKRRLTYPDIKSMMPGRRRQVHDDITVVVLFLDSLTSHANMGSRRKPAPPREFGPLSVQGFQQFSAEQVANTEGEVDDVPEVEGEAEKKVEEEKKAENGEKDSKVGMKGAIADAEKSLAKRMLHLAG